MASYIDTYMRLCYEANIEDARTKAGMDGIIKALAKEKYSLIQASESASNAMLFNSGCISHKSDVSFFQIAGSIGVINLAISHHNERVRCLLKKQFGTAADMKRSL